MIRIYKYNNCLKREQLFKTSNFLGVGIEECDNYGACSVTCGGGEQTCENSCVNGNFGDDECPESSRIRKQDCNINDCPRKNFLKPEFYIEYSWRGLIYFSLAPTLSAWPLCSHWALKLIL